MNKQLEGELHDELNDLSLLHISADKFVFARHGLRRVRFYMLRHLYLNPGISITRLSYLSFSDAASTSRIVYSLEKEGFVRRQMKEGDRRKFLLSLTNAGEALYEGVNAELKADIKKRFSSIDSSQLSNILQNVHILGEAIMQHRDEQEGK
jgi:MarR family 2-MHQ and catechol resistance regulon transcriptional repressor